MVCEIKSCLMCEKTATYCTIYIVMPAILDQPHTWARLNSWQKCSGRRVWMWRTCMSARPKNRQQGKVSQAPQVQQVCQHCLWAALNDPPPPNPSTKSLTHHSFILFVMLTEAYISAEYVNRQHEDARWGWETMRKSIPVVCGCVLLMKPINLFKSLLVHDCFKNNVSSMNNFGNAFP